ncbi:MAG: hypothetical protein KDA42_04375 [Planctomycetales bacterium]|nr:hypothetical protein [Planctomycetales bacterium]
MSYDPSQFEQGGQFGQPAPKKKKSAVPMVVGIIVGVGLLAIALCCGVGVWVMNLGMSTVAEVLQEQLKDDPQIQEHIGEIESFDFSWLENFNKKDGEDAMVFNIEGSKANGKLVVKGGGPNAAQGASNAELRLENGDVIEIDLQESFGNLEEMEGEFETNDEATFEEQVENLDFSPEPFPESNENDSDATAAPAGE